jgi:hypothetical protein
MRRQSRWTSSLPTPSSSSLSFGVAKDFVKTVKLTNDVAERAVKMSKDYETILTKDDGIRTKLLQGVEKYRQKFPNFMRKPLNGQI